MRVIEKGAEYLWAAAAYVLVAVGFYRDVLFGDKTFPVDVPDLDYPRFFFLSKWFHQHVIALWDPHVGLGIPLAGMMGCQTFYPPLYLAMLLGGATPSIRVVEWITVLHLAFGGLAAYTLCRALRLARAASFVGGLLFAFGGFFALRLFHGGWVETAAWFPFALAAWVRFLQTRKLKYTAWMSAVFLIMMLTGFWQQVMYSMYFTLFWALSESVWRFTRRERMKFVLLPLVAVCVACGAALICDACELLPTFRYAKDTVRQKLTFDDSAGTGLRVSDVPAVLWAGMFTGKDGLALWNARRVNSGIRDYYPGTFTLLLVAYSLCLLVQRPERNQTFLWIALVVFAAASFGPLTPVFWFLYKVAPGFSYFRRSGALYYFPVLAAAVLAAFTLNDWLKPTPVLSLRMAWRVLALAGIIPLAAVFFLQPGLASRGALLYFVAMELLALAVFTAQRFPSAVWGVALLSLADLYYFHGVQFAFLLRNFKFPSVAGISQLQDSPTDPYRVALAPFGGTWDNRGEILGFENPGGYLIFRLQRYQDYMQRIHSPDSPLLAEANARYLLTTPPLMREGLRTLAIAPNENRVEIPSGLPADPPYIPSGDFPGSLKLFRDLDAVPRYYFSSSVEVIPERAKQLDRMSEPSFPQSRSAVLDANPGVSIDNCSQDTVQVLNSSPNQTRLRTISHANCLLISTVSYDADWRIYVDGKRTSVYIANTVFRASVVPVGTHLVEMKFEPRTLWLGMAISAACGLALLGLSRWGSPVVEVYLET